MSDDKPRADRQLLIDGVQLALLRYADIRAKYHRSEATILEVINAHSLLDEAEAALRAHEEVFGRELKDDT